MYAAQDSLVGRPRRLYPRPLVATITPRDRKHSPNRRKVSDMALASFRALDGKWTLMNSLRCPVKRRRATLGSDPLRDSWARLRRISVRGDPRASPPLLRAGDIQSCLLCLRKPQGFGGRAPNYTRLSKRWRVSLHVEPRDPCLLHRASCQSVPLVAAWKVAMCS